VIRHPRPHDADQWRAWRTDAAPTPLPTMPVAVRVAAFAVLGIVALYAVHRFSEPAVRVVALPVATVAAIGTREPIAVSVDAVLHLPTSTPVPPRPTAMPTGDPRLAWCDAVTPKAGESCIWPPAATRTPAPLPECGPGAEPGEWCQWRGNEETKQEVETR
jgi:hypothetical protein